MCGYLNRTEDIQSVESAISALHVTLVVCFLDLKSLFCKFLLKEKIKEQEEKVDAMLQGERKGEEEANPLLSDDTSIEVLNLSFV